MPTLPHWPTEVESRRLEADLTAGAATAPGEIASAFLDPLAAYLRRRFPTADPHDCESAAADAVLATVRGENRYDPARLPLGAFLRMAAARDLMNLLRKSARWSRVIPLDSVAEPAACGNCLPEDDAPGWDDPRLVAEIAAFAATDQLALVLMRAGVRGTEQFARAVGLSAASPGELASLVKRFKDRLKKRLAGAVGGVS